MCGRGTQTGGWGNVCNWGHAQSNHFINHYSSEPRTWWLMEGVVKAVAGEEITLGVRIMYKCWVSGLLNRRGKKKKKVAFLGREGNPLWYSKLSVCWCSLLVPVCAAVTAREGGENGGWGRCAWGARHLGRPVPGGTRGVREINEVAIIHQIISF